MRTLLLGLLLLACTPSETLPDCTPGATVACACVGGGSGAQTCSTGRAYGACVCPDGGAGDVPGADVTVDVLAQDTAPDVAMDSGGVDAADAMAEAGGDVTGDTAADALICPAGRENCDNVASNGCEQDIASDPAHCGGCSTRCVGVIPNALPTCRDSVCVLGACALGFGNCDSIASNGCETNTMTDRLNCGACHQTCTRECVNARCQ